MLLSNPKRTPQLSTSPSQWGGYYAGYSPQFVRDALRGLELPEKAMVVDPWNGSGTTTAVAQQLAYNAHGYDLNPAIVVVAKARLLAADITPSQYALSDSILREMKIEPVESAEPLSVWFSPRAAAVFRAIERAVCRLLVNADARIQLGNLSSLNVLSPLAARFYVALFRTARAFLDAFHTTNPTWIKEPDSPRARLRPNCDAIKAVFSSEVRKIFTGVEAIAAPSPIVTVDRANCERLPLVAESADAIITSPPYCTRIDYAIATKPELALLGVGGVDFLRLRRRMLGSTLSEESDIEAELDWGNECKRLLKKIKAHKSKASATYYYRTHARYFSSLAASYSEIVRILKPGRRAVVVLQDSYYKDVHNDLQRITIEMMEARGARITARHDHHLSRTKAALNPRCQRYRTTSAATESVLIFEKQIGAPNGCEANALYNR